METEDKDTDEYWALVYKLPSEYRDIYHLLIQKGIIYIFMSMLAQRGREGISNVMKDDFVKFYDEDVGYHYWSRMVIRLSKNHH